MHAKVIRAQILNWVTCWFQCMVLWQKVGSIWGESGVGFGQKARAILGMCREGFGCHLYWGKCGSRKGLRKLGVSDFKNM